MSTTAYEYHAVTIMLYAANTTTMSANSHRHAPEATKKPWRLLTILAYGKSELPAHVRLLSMASCQTSARESTRTVSDFGGDEDWAPQYALPSHHGECDLLKSARLNRRAQGNCRLCGSKSHMARYAGWLLSKWSPSYLACLEVDDLLLLLIYRLIFSKPEFCEPRVRARLNTPPNSKGSQTSNRW